MTLIPVIIYGSVNLPVCALIGYVMGRRNFHWLVAISTVMLWSVLWFVVCHYLGATYFPKEVKA